MKYFEYYTNHCTQINTSGFDMSKFQNNIIQKKWICNQEISETFSLYIISHL